MEGKGYQIPKVIHYCWFGGSQLPDLALKCIDSWEKNFPDYEIKEWNESNFNINSCNYVREAYDAKKWAFVSDYARFQILYNEGGIYFDTDVEVIKSFDDILNRGAFMGCECKNEGVVNPGLGLGVAPGLGLYKEILEHYHNSHFINDDGSYNLTTVVKRSTDILVDHGFDPYNNHIQHVAGLYIYPEDFFCPMNYNTGELNITENTHSIHYYTASWHSPKENELHKRMQVFKRHFGDKWGNRVGLLCTIPLRISIKYKQTGMTGIFDAIKRRVRK